MPYHKYHAKKTIVDGIKFDSKAEAQRYIFLKALEQKGTISDLKRQVPFLLIPALNLKKPHRKNGRLVYQERKVTYVADFVYQKDGETIVEDVKGVKTPEYIIKRKLMLQKYGIEIQEVRV